VQLRRRAEIHAALGDPARLAVVDELLTSDRSPGELSALLGVAPPLLAFHLDALERAGLIRRTVSSGDRRRRYVQLVSEALDAIGARPAAAPAAPMVFVCTRNSARSQLAAALWRRETGDTTATSAGTEPADAVHPGALAAARRVGLDLGDAVPRRLPLEQAPRQLVTVCDRAHEDLRLPSWHWSIPDPVDDGTDEAFDRAVARLRARIVALHIGSREIP
jgi:protein-tyrosine-phosphatase